MTRRMMWVVVVISLLLNAFWVWRWNQAESRAAEAGKVAEIYASQLRECEAVLDRGGRR